MEQTIYIVVSVSGYEEFETIERCYSRESLAENFITLQNKERTELGLRKAKFRIIEQTLN